MKRFLKSFMSLLSGIVLITVVTGCQINVNQEDPVIDITIALTQTPVTPLNGEVTVNVDVTPKSVQSLKWLAGEKTAADFAKAGTALTAADGKASFVVDKSGYYTVYAKVNSKSEKFRLFLLKMWNMM